MRSQSSVERRCFAFRGFVTHTTYMYMYMKPAVVTLAIRFAVAGQILDVKGDSMDHDDLYEMFDSRRCPALSRKPKLVFFQACRGGYISLHCACRDN